MKSSIRPELTGRKDESGDDGPEMEWWRVSNENISVVTGRQRFRLPEEY